ncbi:6-phosphogluconate dehydrogenase [Fusarium tjaetaba]|uniref:6-phosphogluconate dehydrogenase n=1 Tax=Fusarium tjaetaba TaxID=1567544 RepID=A0A8H5W795_9HYPO|nr:6-phosphogluconate dehydrogenase [Fusarium tjaetaba]KAF5647853.1 6-phosphogluconate dehydrogenase [Fusarium tjaetaba]
MSTIKTVFQLDCKPSFFESITVRPSGALIVTRQDTNEIWEIDSFSGTGKCIVTVPDVASVTGIAQVLPDVYAFGAGTYRLANHEGTVPGSYSFWVVDLRGTAPDIRLVVKMPEVGQLNGLAAWDAEAVLAADSGTLIFTTAGAKSSIEKIRPYIKDAMGRDEISFEDEPHSHAAKFKLIGNAFALNAITQIAESLTLAEKSGISPETVAKFTDIMYGGISSVYSGRMISGEYWTRDEPYASADIAMKDIKHLLELAQETNMELKNAQTGLMYLQMATEKSPGHQADISAIYGAVRKANGLEFKNRP